TSLFRSTSPARGPARSSSTISSGFLASKATAARVFMGGEPLAGEPAEHVRSDGGGKPRHRIPGSGTNQREQCCVGVNGRPHMNRILYLGAAALSALSLAACNQQEAKEASPGQTGPVNAAQDATSAAVGQTSASTLGNTTEGFATGAAV